MRWAEIVDLDEKLLETAASRLFNRPRLGSGQFVPIEEAPARLPRIIYHAQSNPFLVISAERHDLTGEQNHARSVELMQLLRVHQLGGIQMEGHWLEAGSEPVIERSFFVALNERAKINGKQMTGDDLLSLGIALGKRFQQEAILYGDTRWVYEVECATGDFELCGSTNGITLKQIGVYYSRIHNRSFTFKMSETRLEEGYRLVGYRVPSNFATAVGMSASGLWY